MAGIKAPSTLEGDSLAQFVIHEDSDKEGPRFSPAGESGPVSLPNCCLVGSYLDQLTIPFRAPSMLLPLVIAPFLWFPPS